MPNTSIHLPEFQCIDTRIGLKYLNENKILYLKVLNNFLERYENYSIESLNEIELQNTIHTIKGLSATLGMTQLSELSIRLHNKEVSFEMQGLLSQTLESVVNELKNTLRKEEKEKASSILIINNNPDEIDKLMEILDEESDILLALNKYEALELFDTEEIALVILTTEFNFLTKHTNIGKLPTIVLKSEGQTIDKNINKYLHIIEQPFEPNIIKNIIKNNINY